MTDTADTVRIAGDRIRSIIERVEIFIGREKPAPSLRPELSRWQEPLYAFMARNAVRSPDYYRIPPARVVELGTQVEMLAAIQSLTHFQKQRPTSRNQVPRSLRRTI
ncbi:KUP/HAK/KT family potassium transporter [Methylobacterium sp. CM6257]|jgi:KUP system potassium uptake protein